MTQHQTYSDRLKWAEEQGSKNLGEKFTTGDNMNKEAQTTLTYVLAGMGGTFAFVFHSLVGEPGSHGDQIFSTQLNPLIVGCALLCAYYTALGVFLVFRTMKIGDFPSPYQEPENLVHDEAVALDSVRMAEIRNMTVRIGQAQEWIGKKSRAINFVRFMLVISPAVFVAFVAACIYFRWI